LSGSRGHWVMLGQFMKSDGYGWVVGFITRTVRVCLLLSPWAIGILVDSLQRDRVIR
jgi:hypothetical protein